MSVLTLGSADRAPHLQRLIDGLVRSERLPQELVLVSLGDDQLRLPDRLPFETTLVGGCGVSLAQARNRAAAAATGEQLIFLDVDCIPGFWLTRAYERALGTVDGLVMGPVRYLLPSKHVPAADEQLRAISAEHPQRICPADHGVLRESRYELFWSLSFAIGNETFERLGGFDELLQGYGGEDTDLAFTARALGMPLSWVGEAEAFHQFHPKSEPPLEHLTSIVSNAAIFKEKWGEWPMQEWLREFAELGLIDWDPSHDSIGTEQSEAGA